MQLAQTSLILACVLSVAIQALSIIEPNHLSLAHPFHNSYKHPQCHRLPYPGVVGLDPTNCATAANVLCESLIPEVSVPREKWVWVDLVGCSVGYYVQNYAIEPEMESCKFDVFREMRAKCAYNSSVNAGTLNVAVLPDFSQNGTAIWKHSAMYMMAPERQTL